MHGKQLRNLQKPDISYLPVDAFTQVETEILMSSEEGMNTVGAVGSGIVFYTDYENTYVLTANHVCIPPFYERIMEVYDDEIVIVNSIVDYSGETRTANVIYNDENKDLCILKISGVWTSPVRISNQEPEIGDRAYSLAAPGGFFSPGMVPIFEGIYSGKINDFIDRDDIYTIPTQSGSSGAAVLNEEFEIIGLIHSAVYGNDNIGIAATHEEVSEFIYGWEVLFGFRVHQDSM